MHGTRSFASPALALALLLLTPLLVAAQAPTTTPVAHEHAALLYVNPLRSDDGKTIDNDAMWQRAILSQAAMVGGETVLLETLEQPGVRETQWYAQFKRPEAALDALRRDLRAQPLAGTALVAIWVQGAGVDAARLANAVAEVRLKRANEAARMNKDRRLIAVKVLQERVAEQLETLRDQIRKDLANADAAGQPMRQLDLDERMIMSRRLSERLAAINDQLAEQRAADVDLPVTFAEPAR